MTIQEKMQVCFDLAERFGEKFPVYRRTRICLVMHSIGRLSAKVTEDKNPALTFLETELADSPDEALNFLIEMLGGVSE